MSKLLTTSRPERDSSGYLDRLGDEEYEQGYYEQDEYDHSDSDIQ